MLVSQFSRQTREIKEMNLEELECCTTLQSLNPGISSKSIATLSLFPTRIGGG
jgi:hypothetical protein